MPIQFSKRAEADLASIGDFIAKDSLTYAAKFTDEIVTILVRQLGVSPKSGRPGRVEGTRELIIRHNYIVAYRLKKEGIVIVTILHTARLWPKLCRK
jgi:toxin ParE1/3/4